MDRESLLESVKEHVTIAREHHERAAKKAAQVSKQWQMDKETFIRSLEVIERSKERLGRMMGPER